MSSPVVAIVGAPNVGKSTLFNRMLGRRQSIVSDRPGVTRDRIAAPCDLFGTSVLLVDTGGVVTKDADRLTSRVRAEALKAVEQADVILFVVDARAGLTGTDQEVGAILRSSGKPIVPVANKIDATTLEGLEFELYRLGLGDVIALSAEQGRGLDELVERIRGLIPAARPAVEQDGVPIAIVGRPNVGKSSLFNRIVREDRVLVDASPGTTRDPIDARFLHQGTVYRIIDTAGIRRRAGGGEEVEWVSVLKARQALERAAIAIAIVDATTSIEHQDLAILGLVARHHVPAILVANKIDLLPPKTAAATVRSLRAQVPFASYVPIEGISALQGRGIGRLLDVVEAVRQESLSTFPTAALNRVLEQILREKQPPADGGREVRLRYVTQIGGPPPRFAVFGNGARVTPAWRRFFESRLRERLGLRFTPIVLSFRRGSR